MVVHLLTNHGDKFLGHGVNDAVLANEGERVLGTPPMKLLAAAAPVASVPLGDAGRDVAVIFDDVVATKWQLPTDFGFEWYVAFAIVDGHDVQCTARTAVEVRAIEKDARVFYQSGHDVAIFLDPRGALATLRTELPLVVGESRRCLLDALAVLGVGEMRAVTTTPLY